MTSFEIKQNAQSVASKYRIILMVGILALVVVGLFINYTLKNSIPEVDNSQTNKPANDLSLIESFAPFGHPLASKKDPSSLYGWRVDPFTLHSKRHHGVDFSAPAGTPVLATGDGKVIQSSYDLANGHFIEIEHGTEKGKNIYRTKFAHLKSAYVRAGEAVKVGQTIGEVGSTGRSTSPHLHYEVSYLNEHINPLHVIGKDSIAVAKKDSDSNKFSPTNPNLQRVLFIRNSGVEYRMVDLSKPQPF